MKALWNNTLIALNLMSCRLVRKLIIALLLIVGFILCGMTLLCINISDYDSIEYRKQCDITRTGCMANDNEEELSYNPDDPDEKIDLTRQQPYEQFYNDLKKSGLVEKCAQYSIFGNRYVDKDIVRIQEGHQIADYAVHGCVEFIYAQKDIFDIYNIKINPKVAREDWDSHGVILGSKFREKYGNAEYIYFQEEKRKLLGFVADDQKLSFEEVAFRDDVSLTGLYNLDYAFFYLTPEDFYTGYEIHFRLAKDVTREEFREKVRELAKKHKTVINSMFFMDEHLSKLRKNNIAILGSITSYAIILLIGITLICIAGKVHSIFNNKKLYGILYSSGLSANQINFLFVIENAIMLLFSLLIACLCLHKGIYIFCGYFGQAPHLIVDVVDSILVSKVYLQEALICLSMIIITSGIPMIVFSKLTPLSMMRDFYE